MRWFPTLRQRVARPGVLAASGATLGVGLLTLALVAAFGRPLVVVPAIVGVVLLGAIGLRTLGVILWYGAYALTQEAKDGTPRQRDTESGGRTARR